MVGGAGCRGRQFRRRFAHPCTPSSPCRAFSIISGRANPSRHSVRNPRLAPVCPGKLPADGPGRVGVVAQVHGPQHGLPEVLGVVERPQRRLQALDHVATADDLRRLLAAEAAPRPPRQFRDEEYGLPSVAATAPSWRPEPLRGRSPGSAPPEPAPGTRTPTGTAGWRGLAGSIPISSRTSSSSWSGYRWRSGSAPGPVA